jgi:hypothetical protein
VNEFAFIPPDEMFGDVEVVMEPKVAIEGVTGDNLRRIYGPYIAANSGCSPRARTGRSTVALARLARKPGGGQSPPARHGEVLVSGENLRESNGTAEFLGQVGHVALRGTGVCCWTQTHAAMLCKLRP